MTTIVIEKNDEATSKDPLNYMEYNEENIPTVTVKVNENRSKGRTFIHIRPRADRVIMNETKKLHEEVHADEDKTCFGNCHAHKRLNFEINKLQNRLKELNNITPDDNKEKKEIDDKIKTCMKDIETLEAKAVCTR